MDVKPFMLAVKSSMRRLVFRRFGGGAVCKSATVFSQLPSERAQDGGFVGWNKATSSGTPILNGTHSLDCCPHEQPGRPAAATT